MKKALGEIAYRIKRNPVLVATAALWAENALTAGGPISLRSGAIVAVGFLVRSQVVPANEVVILGDFIKHLVDEAKAETKKA